MPSSGIQSDTVHEGESRPRECFHLTDAAITASSAHLATAMPDKTARLATAQWAGGR
jgi:hypothetical protein